MLPQFLKIIFIYFSAFIIFVNAISDLFRLIYLLSLTNPRVFKCPKIGRLFVFVCKFVPMSSGAVLEANFVRLLHCTETLSASGTFGHDDLLIYYKKLHELLNSLTKSNTRPAAEFLHIYKTRVS